MTDLFWLSDDDMRRIAPYFPLAHGIPRVDDRRVLSGIIFVARNGLHWPAAPTDYGPHKTIYNRFTRWSRLGVFDRMLAGVVAQGDGPEQLLSDLRQLKARRATTAPPRRRLRPVRPDASRAA